MIAALDIIASLAFAMASAFAAYGLFVVRQRRLALPEFCAMGAAAVMAVVSVGNAFGNLGISDRFQDSEAYAEILVPAFVIYLSYGLYRRSQIERAEQQERSVQRLSGRLTESMQELGQHRLGMLEALTAAVDARDHYTATHSMHVADISCALGHRLGMEPELTMLEQAGLLHDIGKIGVADTVLLKPARLDDAEYKAIKQHVVESAHIIETIPFLSPIVPLVKYHHEHWDGSGYPDGLAGAAIPRAARVLAVADAFDAMTTDRPYRPAMDVAEARAHLMEARGTQFDPEVVDALLDLLDEGVIQVGVWTGAC